MKKYLLPLIFLMVPFWVSGYNWFGVGPAGINAVNLCFDVDNSGHMVICADNGMWINDGPAYSWVSYSYGGLPVWDASYYDGQDILLVQGSGSYSDGVYKFNMTTHQFEVRQYLLNPRFLEYDQLNELYYAGYAAGLMTSPDGAAWSPVIFFNNQECTRMVYLDYRIIISLANSPFNIAYSTDSGVTWNYSNGAPPICDMAFNNTGTLYGIFPDHSNSSGIWKSMDFGGTWYVVTWTEGLSSVCLEAANNLFVGWETPYAGNEGVAWYSLVTQSFTFFNNGLPSTSINRLLFNPYMSSFAVFACTHDGVYRLFDYFTDIAELQEENQEVRVYPDPAGNVLNIRFPVGQQGNKVLKISIMNLAGQLVREQETAQGEEGQPISIDLTGLAKGMYTLRIANGSNLNHKKFIKSL